MLNGVTSQPTMPAARRTAIRHPAPQAAMTPLSRAVTTLHFSGGKQAANPLLDPALNPACFQTKVNILVGDAQTHPARKYDAMASLTEVLDNYLQNTWTDETQPGKKQAVLDGLKTLIGPRGQGNVIMAQIDSVPGDLPGNAKKILAYMDAAEAIGADSIVFPELALMGYPIRDFIGRHPFIVRENVKWLQALAERSGKTRVFVGFVEPREAKKGSNPYGKEHYNAAAILADGKIEGIVRKSLLPTYNEFNEDRQFESSPASGVHHPSTLGSATWGFQDHPSRNGAPASVHGHDVGVTICEDIWNDDEFFDRNLYTRDPYAETAHMMNLLAPDAKNRMMVNLSASPSRENKEKLKNNMLAHMAEKYGIPLVYVNRVGAVDEHSFDGSSRVYDAKGKIIARAKSFREQFVIANPVTGGGKIHALPKGLEEANRPQKGRTPKGFDPYDQSDLGRTYETILQGIRGYFRKTGLKKAVLGLSGGLDSTIAATLLADAIGPENVLGISMPSKITQFSSKNDAKILAKNLGIEFRQSPIVAMVNVCLKGLNALYKVMPQSWGERVANSVTVANLQARLRAIILWSVSNEYKGVMPIATSDKSELYMGYATINGDMSGGFAPIADVPKTKLFALGRWMNENRAVKNAIPEAVLLKKPGAELQIDPKTGKPLEAETDLMPYEFLDEAIWRVENYGESLDEMMATPFYYEKQRAGSDQTLSPEAKKQWLEKFFRMKMNAVFKWTLLPPGVIVSGKSINKADYQQPITTRTQWQPQTPAQIAAALDASRPRAKTANA